MMKTTKFYVKIFIKNPLFFISLLLNIFLLYKQSSSVKYSIFEFSEVFYFGFICSNLFLLIISTYVTYKDYIIFNFLEKNLLKKQLGILISSVIVSTIMALIPIITMIIVKNPTFQLKFVLYGIVHFFILWTLSNLLAATIGCFVGSLCKNRASMILSFSIYGLFMYHSYNSSYSIISKLFNIYDDFTMIAINSICGCIFNKAYYLDKLFVLLLSIFIFSIICLFNKNIKKLYSSCFFSLSFIFICLNVYFSFNCGSTFLKEYKTLDSVGYSIESYNMDIKLKNTLENTATINLKINKNLEDIIMEFDDLFKIKDLSINGSKPEFYHEEDKLKIKHKFIKGDRVKILIKYSGYVDVINYMGSPIYYVSKYATNLPIASFYWYPKGPKESLTDFDISVKGYNSIYSNLSELNNTNNTYEFKGKSLGLNLFSGQYKKCTLNNIEYILPTSIDLKYFKSNIEDIIKDKNNIKNLSKKQLDFLKNHKYKKVICCIWDSNTLNSYVQIFEDALIIH